ncbi:4017_t:CDS:2 [Cetraspora pellucida]|uniref:4017_t:CDS:1 n=1 Tax=Cetraspora pellucida TaxID=1433469 RepID=A0ACA9KHI0_9GLOM|nr:4017_t:CDS:2 [Cetraspora pellucida]
MWVIIGIKEYEIPTNIQTQLENAIEVVNKLLEHQEDKEYFQNYLQNILEVLERKEDKEYFLKFFKKIDNQFDYFTKFEKKDLKFSNYFNQMIYLIFMILSDLANLQTKVFSSIERLNNINLENTQQYEINLSFSKIDEWINDCINIIDKSRKVHEDYSKLIENIEDCFFFFEIQEEILTKIHDIKTNLLNNSKEIDKPKVRRLLSSSKEKS